MSEPTLDDLIALNQEIAAFVRAGIPIELGLKGLSGSVGSRLGRLSDRLSNRLSQGKNLSEAIAEEGPIVSPVYTAVVEAGLASGRLPEALQSLTDSSQMIQETRRRVVLAAIYPVICLGVAYGMFCFFISMIVPHIAGVVDDFGQKAASKTLFWLHDRSDYFTMLIPSVVLAIVVVVGLLRQTHARRIWQRLTSLRWVAGRSLNLSQFTEILGLQVEHGAPLPQAFVLAADSTTDRKLQAEARKVCHDLTSGRSFVDALQSVRSLPPLVRWMLSSGERQGALQASLRQLSGMYHRKALRRATIAKIWIPVTMTIFLTGIIGLVYGLAFFVPLRMFLLGLMQE